MNGTPTPQFVVLACDESGLKGYADRDERTVGEVGVFASIMVPGELLARAQAQFDAVAQKYQTSPATPRRSQWNSSSVSSDRNTRTSALVLAGVATPFRGLLRPLRRCAFAATAITYRTHRPLRSRVPLFELFIMTRSGLFTGTALRLSKC